MIGLKKDPNRGRMDLVITSKNYVNEIVRPYFKEFGTKIGASLMEAKRMKVIFLWALECPNLSEENKDHIKEWLQEHGKSN